jgi:hypothetical protein
MRGSELRVNLGEVVELTERVELEACQVVELEAC